VKPNWHEKFQAAPPFRYYILSAGDKVDLYLHARHGLAVGFQPYSDWKRTGPENVHLVQDLPWRTREWNHIALAWEAGRAFTFYVNGIRLILCLRMSA